MKQKNDMAMKRIFIILMAVILLSSSVFAFAISSKYYSGKPLYVQPGQSVDTFLILQNVGKTEALEIRTEIKSGSEFIKLKDADGRYTIPGGTKLTVDYTASVPADANIGDLLPIYIIFTTVTSGEGGTLGIGSAIGQRFDIAVGQESDFIEPPILAELPESKVSFTLYWIIAAVILLIIIIIIVARKKKAKK